MFLEIFIQMLPYLAVFAVLGYIGRIQQKKAKEREEEQKKGIIRTCYVLKTEKILTIFFIVAVVLFGGATVLSALQQKDLLPPVGFGIFFIIALIVYVNGEKLFTIDSGIDDSEFMEDIERRKIPIRAYWGKRKKNKRKHK